MGTPAAVPHLLRRPGASPAVMRVFAVLVGCAHTMPTARSSVGSVSAFSLLVFALWSSVVGVAIDVALLAVAVRAGSLSRAGAPR